MSEIGGPGGVKASATPQGHAPLSPPMPAPAIPAIAIPASSPPPISAQPPGRLRRRVLLLIASLVVLTLAFVSVLALDVRQASRRDPQTDNAYVGGDATTLSARVQGYLRRLPIRDNQVVRAGTLIAEIEADDYRAQWDRAQAQVAAAQADLESIDSQLRQSAEQTAQTRTGETAALADTGRATPELRRQQLLSRTELSQPRELERAQADQRRFEASVEASRAMVVVRQLQADVLVAQRLQAVATLRARRASLELARITVGWTRLVAPFDGTLGARLVREGDLLSRGARIAVLTPLATVWVDANFTERQITGIRVGQPARLVLDGFPDEPLDGHVTALSPTTGGVLSAVPADNTTGNFTKVVQRVPVRIAIDWHGSSLLGRVRPGMSVTATVFTGDTPVGDR